MFSLALGGNLRKESLSPGYFFYGEETYPAEKFVRELQDLLIPPDAADFRPDLFFLDETDWAEILDAARTMPFLFSPWRIVLVKVPEKDPDSDKSGEKEARLVSAAEEELLKSYFAAPPSRSLMVVILPGKVKKGHLLVRVFSSLPGVVAKELKHLKEEKFREWMDEKARSVSKGLTTDAVRRLIEIVGCDQQLMDHEIEKLAVYVDDKKIIDASDVDEATAWLRDFDSFELDEELGKANLHECLIILHNLFKLGKRPEQILNRLVCFFRDVLFARTSLQEKGADKKEIFKKLFPKLQLGWPITQEKWSWFFPLVESLSEADLALLLKELENVDILIKSSDAEAQRLFEVFLYRYCRLRQKTGIISRVSGRSLRPGG